MENFTEDSLRRQIAHSGQGQQTQNQERNLDVLVRQAMGELVRKYMEAGKLEDLQAILREHRVFIDDILNLSTQKKPPSS